MRSFLGLLFFIDLCGFFHIGSAAAKNTGDVHPFKPFFIWLCRVVLRLLKPRNRFRSFRLFYFLFLYDRRGFSAVKNSGRFHARFSSVFLLKLRGNGTGGFSVLKKSAVMVFWGL